MNIVVQNLILGNVFHNAGMAQVAVIILHATRTCISCIVNTMAADDLATQVARSSAAMVVSQFSWNISVSAPWGLTIKAWKISLDLVGHFEKLTSHLWEIYCKSIMAAKTFQEVCLFS